VFGKPPGARERATVRSPTSVREPQRPTSLKARSGELRVRCCRAGRLNAAPAGRRLGTRPGWSDLVNRAIAEIVRAPSLKTLAPTLLLYWFVCFTCSVRICTEQVPWLPRAHAELLGGQAPTWSTCELSSGSLLGGGGASSPVKGKAPENARQEQPVCTPGVSAEGLGWMIEQFQPGAEARDAWAWARTRRCSGGVS
jgi:hypothetical protein